MCDAAEKDNHGERPLQPAGVQERPKRRQSRLHIVGHKQIETVPGSRHDRACAKGPGAVATRENHDRNIKKRLEKVKQTKLWNHPRRHGEGHNEKRAAGRNP